MWGRILNLNKINSKIKNFTFHHEITTDGVAVSILYSKNYNEPVKKKIDYDNDEDNDYD